MPDEKKKTNDEEMIEGGVGDDLTYEDVNLYELALGTYIELEHVGESEELTNEEIYFAAMDIAFDHLAEEGQENYYSKLVEMEGKVETPDEREG